MDNLVIGEGYTLNATQTEAIIDAIADGFVDAEQFYELLNHETFTAEDKYNNLIDKVIVPYGLQKLNEQITQRIDDGEFTYINVDRDGETPAFTYTVGGIPLIGAELLYVGEVPFNPPASIVNQAFDTLKDIEELTSDLGPVGTLVVSGDVRYRITSHPLHQNVGKFLKMVPTHFPDYPQDTPVYVIELADSNNLLPGEEGYDATFVQYSHVVSVD